MNTTFLLALRNLTRQKRRSFILALAIGFGFFVVTLIDGLASGAVNNLIDQIFQLNGGNVLVEAIKHQTDEDGNIVKKYSFVCDEPDYIENLVKKNNIKFNTYSKRTMSDGTIIFNKKKIPANVFGCIFEKEQTLIDSFIIEEGNVEDIFKPYSMVITKKNADTLNVKIGDTVLYTTTTIEGQNTVGEFTVALIIKDNSIMNSILLYAPIDSINELVGMKSGEYNVFSIFVENNKQTLVAQQIEDLIRADGKPVSNRIEAIKSDPNNPAGKMRKQVINMMIPDTIYLCASMKDAEPMMAQIVTIVHAVTTCILIVILLIVMVGISNTYRMILYERLREIGTMRAVGMSGKNVGKLFSTEAAILSMVGALVGFFLALILMFIISKIHVDYEALSFFMKNGCFSYQLSFGSIVLKYVIMLALTMIAVRGTAKKASELSPAQALR